MPGTLHARATVLRGGKPLGVTMKFKEAYLISFCFLGSVLAISCAPAEEVTGEDTGGQRQFPQLAPEREVTVTAIPGVIAVGAEWELVWQGPDNADGLVATEDGGIVFAQEQPSTVGRLDPNDNFSIFVRDTNGTGGVTFDNQGRLIGAERTCSDPGGRPEECHEPARLVVLHPTREVLASNYNGQTFWRMPSRQRHAGAWIWHRSNVRCWGQSGPRFPATPCLLIAESVEKLGV